MSETKKTFSIIRYRGQPSKLQLPDGTWVYKQSEFYIQEYNGYVKAADYLDHFLYAIPEHLAKLYPGSIYRCSCGAPAIVAGLSGYIMDASPQGKLMLCMVHSTTGYHAGSDTKWV